MMKLSTKEHLIFFMQSGMMNLSTLDLSFIQNLHHIIIKQNGITTNQVKLFEKIIKKYNRQFKKQKFKIELLENLPWTTTIIESDPIYTDAYISIENNKIYFKSPYNKGFFFELKKLIINPFTFDKINKRYEADFSTSALRIIFELANKHFEKVHYCPMSSDLIISNNKYNDVKIWNPTLVSVNNYCFIASCNQHLYNAIKDIDLKIDMKTISLLTEYGIKCSDDLLIHENIKFANELIVEVNLKDIDRYIEYLRLLDCDAILISRTTTSKISQMVVDKLTNANIEVVRIEGLFSTYTNLARISKYKYPVLLTLHSTVSHIFNKFYPTIKKHIKIIDTNPIILDK